MALLAVFGLVSVLLPRPAAAIERPLTIPWDDWNAAWDEDDPWPTEPGWPQPTANPSITGRCGIDIAVLVDRSGSIAEAGQGDAYKAAVADLIDTLAGTPSKIGVWSFGGAASGTHPVAYPWHQMVDVGGTNGPANVAALKATVASIPIVRDEATNWDDGLRAILRDPVAASPRPDVLVVLTDGQPTVHAHDSGSGNVVNHDDLAGGIVSANLVKAAGTRILAVGVGPDVAVAGLKLISGSTPYDGSNIATADYLTTSFADLHSSLHAFATALCGGSVTVQKLASTVAAPDAFAPAAGWAFTGSLADPPAPPITATPTSGVTGADGMVNFKWTSPVAETITITEAPKSGYRLTELACTKAGSDVPVTVQGTSITLTVGPTDVVSCTLRNRAEVVDLTVTKADSGAAHAVGSTVAYTIGYQNAGTTTATGVVLTEEVPARTTFAPASSSTGWTCPTGAAGDTCTLALGDLAAGATGTVTFAVSVDSPMAAGVMELSNTVVISGTNENRDELPNTATDTTPLVEEVAVAVDKTDGVDEATPGQVLTYDITVTNTSSHDLEGLVLREDIPAHTTFVADHPANAGWTATATLGRYERVVSVAVGSPLAVQLPVRVDAPVPAGVDELVNTVTILRATAALDQATDVDELLAVPDLRVAKTDGGVTAEPGDEVTYTITYANVGDQGATGVVLTEHVPEGTTFVGPAGWTCTAARPCTLAVGALAAGGSGEATFTVRVDEALPTSQTELENLVVVHDSGDDGEDPNPDDNEATELTPVEHTEVAGEVITRPAAPQPLPRTGIGAALLLAVGALLLIGGAVLVVTGRRGRTRPGATT